MRASLITWVLGVMCALGACGSTEVVSVDLAFDGSCVNCHAGLSAGHVHPNYKLRCIDCHGGDDQIDIPANASASESVFRDPALVAASHVAPKAGLARFFFANGVDDDGDGMIDERPEIDGAGTTLLDKGEVFEPGLHGEGPGEFLDTELSRDLNYARFLNPGDLRIATVGCGAGNRAAAEQGGGCHQETVDLVRRSIMVGQTAVIAGAYYGNESSRSDFINSRGATPDPRAGAFAYGLDYAGVDDCIDRSAVNDERGQPTFNSGCLEARAGTQDPAVAAGAPGNAGLPAFEIAQAPVVPVQGANGTTITQRGAGETRYPWGGQPIADPTAARAKLDPVPNGELLAGIPDPVDAALRTFRAYYPLNYPGSTTNFNNTFGSSIQPEATRFATQNPYGRGHSAGCSACHARYSYDGSRLPTQIRQDDGTLLAVADPTTKHREFQPEQDRGTINGEDRLIGRAVTAQQQLDTGRVQQKTYSRDHTMSTAIDTDQCGLCHGFVTRINLAYQGMAEDEQRDQLARRKAIEFSTKAGTNVRISDSWVREDKLGGTPQVIIPEGVAIANAAKARDEMLSAQGLFLGAGGCAAATFSEDCNNNGELDHALQLTRRDENGTVIAQATIDEDFDGDNVLDLIDRAPREKAVDGRQMRYVYGGRNGSQRQMDVHFERGMHCIDCHFLQDVHGDGHVYSTNWDQIEIECEDCHGASQAATLITSGPNGGNDLTRAVDASGRPYFERKDGKIIQRSRVTPGVFWEVPQTKDQLSGPAGEAHGQQHVAEPRAGSTFAGAPGMSSLSTAKVECATCHSSWVLNCMGCHFELSLGDKQRKRVDALGAITKSAEENEVWLANTPAQGHINFQLLALMRSPFVLGVSSSSEQGRLATFRSSMQAHVSVSDANGHNIVDNMTFTTFQAVDGNSGRTGVATSGVAMNQTMPHTTRPSEARGCEMCHSLVDPQGRARNESILAETYGLGNGRFPFVGDWAIAAGTNGLELYEHKQERELAAATPGASNRFPGLIINPTDRVASKVEPVFDGTAGVVAGSIANDVVLVRNFNPSPASGTVSAPTLRDLAITAVDSGTGKLVITDINGRGHPATVLGSVGNTARSFVLTLPAVPRALAHLGPDVSDPFVYAALGTAGVSVIRLQGAPGASPAAAIVTTVPLTGAKTAISLALAGDILYVGTAQGTVDTFDLSNPAAPVPGTSASIGSPVTSIAVRGFLLVAGTPAGVAALTLTNPAAPTTLPGAASAIVVPGIVANNVFVFGSRVFVASGAAGVIELDMRTPAQPVNLGNIAATLAPSQPVNAADVVVSVVPGQTWLLVLDTVGDLWGLKLDGKKAIREKCLPDPVTAGCVLDPQYYDQTLAGRDPSFDPVTQTFDATDPSGVTFFRQTRTLITAGRKLARPATWEQIGTLTGRRLRDSFMPGSGVLSLPVMQRMHSVQLCESNAPSNNAGGLGALGYADAGFLGGGGCQSFGGGGARTLPRSFGPSVQTSSAGLVFELGPNGPVCR